jgi:hypothetical protein
LHVICEIGDSDLAASTRAGVKLTKQRGNAQRAAHIEIGARGACGTRVAQP